MHQQYVIIPFSLFLMFRLSSTGLTSSGAPVPLSAGTYCSSYYPASSQVMDSTNGLCSHISPANCNNAVCQDSCMKDWYHKVSGKSGPISSGLCCPWNLNSGCTLNLFNDPYAAYGPDYIYCSDGCITTAACNPIAHATFTGPADPPTDPNACPFTCNSPFLAVGRACTCGADTYDDGTNCASCPACPKGSYRINCGGTSEGDCTPCSN
jgi:hypothetical protein